MKSRVVKVGIMPREQMRDYTLKVASGEIVPKKGDPKIFFPSLRAFAEAFNSNSEMLLEAIVKYEPETIADLANYVQQNRSNVSRTLKRLSGFGLVTLKEEKGRAKRPIANATGIRLEYDFVHRLAVA